MKNGFLLFLLALGFSVSSMAADASLLMANVSQMQAGSVPAQNWNKLLDIVQKKGQTLETEYGDYVYVEHIEPMDKTLPHVANYFSLVGGRDATGQFNFGRIEVVSESWQQDQDGNWVIDQYLYRISPEGEIISTSHVNMVQTKDRQILKYDSAGLDEAASKSNWQRILNNWYVQIGLD
ncbi:MAG: hypothetical protein B7Y39_03840 [Bdellovibrio sp. 28-41-41]|nr:MAG: hypothetical protein B7Y39_03840 [Bdellovibrio sp. 28-41-41]